MKTTFVQHKRQRENIQQEKSKCTIDFEAATWVFGEISVVQSLVLNTVLYILLYIFSSVCLDGIVSLFQNLNIPQFNIHRLSFAVKFLNTLHIVVREEFKKGNPSKLTKPNSIIPWNKLKTIPYS